MINSIDVTHDLDCEGQDILVEGMKQQVNLTGSCASVSVGGMENEVTRPAAVAKLTVEELHR